MSDEPEQNPLPMVDEFTGYLSQILVNRNQSADVVHFNMVWTDRETRIQVSDETNGVAMFNSEQLQDLGERYARMILALSDMIDAGFNIFRLGLATKQGISGAVIEFFTPQNRKHKFDYFGPATETSIISDVFLQDLEKFPARFS